MPPALTHAQPPLSTAPPVGQLLPTLTHHHPNSTVCITVHAGCGTFYGLGQTYDDM